MTKVPAKSHQKMFMGVTSHAIRGYNQGSIMRVRYPNANLPACWLHCLVCPRRYLAVLPSQARPNLFGSD